MINNVHFPVDILQCHSFAALTPENKRMTAVVAIVLTCLAVAFLIIRNLLCTRTVEQIILPKPDSDQTEKKIDKEELAGPKKFTNPIDGNLDQLVEDGADSKTLQEKIDQQAKALLAKESEIDALKEEIETIKKEAIDIKQTKIANSNADIIKLRDKIEKKAKVLLAKDAEIDKLKAEIEALKIDADKEKCDLKEIINVQARLLKEKDDVIGKLEKKIEEINLEKSSSVSQTAKKIVLIVDGDRLKRTIESVHPNLDCEVIKADDVNSDLYKKNKTLVIRVINVGARLEPSAIEKLVKMQKIFTKELAYAVLLWDATATSMNRTEAEAMLPSYKMERGKKIRLIHHVTWSRKDDPFEMELADSAKFAEDVLAMID